MPIHVSSSDNDLVKSLGAFVVKRSHLAVKEGGRFTIGFSGGSAAAKICQSFQLEEFKNAVDWSKWELFFCDERFVELSHPDSNYKAINDGLIKHHAEISSDKVHTLNMVNNIQETALDYEKQMRSVFKGTDWPCFDLLILGMGPDGHICSLFPNHSLLDDEKHWVGYLCDSPKPPPQRISMTLNAVNNSNCVLFVATGEGKAENVRNVFEKEATKSLPASLVKLKNNEVHWFVDEQAASLLKK